MEGEGEGKERGKGRWNKSPFLWRRLEVEVVSILDAEFVVTFRLELKTRQTLDSVGY